MLRRTKIVATLGPASDDLQTLRKMIDAGLDVARLNFSHGDPDDHRRRAELLRSAAAACGREVGIMGDLQGPKIRIRRFQDHSVALLDGAKFYLDSALGFTDGNQDGVGVALDGEKYKWANGFEQFIDDLRKRIFANVLKDKRTL